MDKLNKNFPVNSLNGNVPKLGHKLVTIQVKIMVTRINSVTNLHPQVPQVPHGVVYKSHPDNFLPQADTRIEWNVNNR